MSEPAILVIGGTTEGKIAAKVCDEAAKPYFYSTKNRSGEVECAHGIRLTGGLDEESMPRFCRDNGVALIIDAAHPFALNVHANIGRTAELLPDISTIRMERSFPQVDSRIIPFDSYQDAIAYLFEQDITSLLALTGVNTIAKLKDYWTKHTCVFRIMRREESLESVKANDFPLEQIVFYDDEQDDEALFKKVQPQAIITKESGESGGFADKVNVALRMGIPVLVIRRPPLPYNPTETVYGPHGLRKKIEALLPSFFPQKTGFTTGSCATAATKAAITTLLTGEEQETSEILLPNGEPVTLPIASTGVESDGGIICCVIKQAGDDPDITDGLEICSSVSWSRDVPKGEVRFLNGEGVGVVTLPGLGLEIGGPAVNATPRKMMTAEVLRTLDHYGYRPDMGINIRVSVPKGRETAGKTFNPRLGIEGGISILGSSGIVKPFSTEAFIASIKREAQVSKAVGVTHLVINSGAKSERYLKALYPDFLPQAFVQYGNFIGETLKIAEDLAFEQVTLCVMIGKAVKLAEGALDTHSKKGVMNKTFLQEVAKESGCSSETIRQIGEITLARQLWEIVPAAERLFFDRLISLCRLHCSSLFTHGAFHILLMDDEGNVHRSSV